MKFRKIIKQITPYGLVMKVHEKNRRATFWELYKQYLKSGKHIEFQEQSAFEYMVSVQGFGYSGSSAVIDLLREYDNAVIFGYIGHNSKAEWNEYAREVDFLRLAGGLLEFEKYIGCNNFFQNDALIQRFMLMVENIPFFGNNINAQELFLEFFRNICYTLRDDMTAWYFNPHLKQEDDKHIQLYFLRNMTLQEYRTICRKFINSLFSVMCEHNKKGYLVLDQFFTDGKYDDPERNYAYCSNLKTIHVCRDPRDMFVETKQLGLEWPNQNAEAFIEWFKIYASGRKIVDTVDSIVIRFEELVLNYDETVKKIEKYLGLAAHQHVAPKTAFDPAISCRSVYLWKNHPEYNDIYRKIETALPEYLYNNY